jgi:hypothetical protein
MTVEAASPEKAQEQVEAALEKAWHPEPHDWQARIDQLDDAQTEHKILCDVILEDDDA